MWYTADEVGGPVMMEIEAARSSRTRARWSAAILGAVAALGLVLALHSQGSGQTSISGSKVRLEGAGATFPALLYKKWIAVYSAQNPDVAIDYKDVGVVRVSDAFSTAAWISAPVTGP
jgi:ABC-type phosphate transport system substrate-binding protein